jgi:DNA-binding MarR family transcriptional regulator
VFIFIAGFCYCYVHELCGRAAGRPVRSADQAGLIIETGAMQTNTSAGPPDGADGYEIGRVGYAIRRAEQAVSSLIGDVLRELDLTVTQYGTLLVLAQSPGLSGAQLARACLVTPQSMATMLAKLSERGLIEREPSEVHHKVMLARLSRAGLQALQTAHELIRPAEDRLALALRPDERGQLVSYLERIAAAVARH